MGNGNAREAGMGADERVGRAGMLYERAVFGGDKDALEAADRELDAAEADLALARGRIAHARFLERRANDSGAIVPEGDEDPRELALFERAAELYRALGDARGEGEALFWVGAFHQTVRHDDGTAVPILERSLGLAERIGDKMTMSHALRHLGIAEHVAGRTDAARWWLEESVRLRREIAFLPGVAANMVGLVHIAIAEGRREDAASLVEEAGGIAEASGARGIARQVDEARARL